MKFVKSEIQNNAGWLSYQGKLIARVRIPRNRGPFITFLVKHFEVEEYFEKAKDLAPAKVLETKGYVSSVVKKILKDAGYPQNQFGFKLYVKDLPF